MKAALTFDQILSLVRQLPQKQKIELSKELERELIDSKLSSLLKAFRTDELDEQSILTEVESVRQELYDKKEY